MLPNRGAGHEESSAPVISVYFLPGEKQSKTPLNKTSLHLQHLNHLLPSLTPELNKATVTGVKLHDTIDGTSALLLGVADPTTGIRDISEFEFPQ